MRQHKRLADVARHDLAAEGVFARDLRLQLLPQLLGSAVIGVRAVRQLQTVHGAT